MSGRGIRRRVLLGAVPLAAVLLAAPASAQTGGDSCEGKLTGAGRQAELSFSCNFNVTGLMIFSNKDAKISGDLKGEEGQGREGFVCPQPVLKGPAGRQGGDTFGEDPALCEGNLSPDNTATGTLVARDDVCDPLALRVTASGVGEDTFFVRIQGCARDDDDEDDGTRPDEDEDDGARPDEDEGQVPRGGVDAGSMRSPLSAQRLTSSLAPPYTRWLSSPGGHSILSSPSVPPTRPHRAERSWAQRGA